MPCESNTKTVNEEHFQSENIHSVVDDLKYTINLFSTNHRTN